MHRINTRRSALRKKLCGGLVSLAFVMTGAPSFADSASATSAGSSSAPAARSGGRHSLPLAVSLLSVMRASVEIPADGLWQAQSEEKLSDPEWLLADQDSASLAAAATLMSLGGTGPKDHQWVANADWQAWSLDVQNTALQIRAAALAKNKVKFDAGADHLTEVCQNCHTKYRPENPSDGVARYPFYPKRDLVK